MTCQEMMFENARPDGTTADAPAATGRTDQKIYTAPAERGRRAQEARALLSDKVVSLVRNLVEADALEPAEPSLSLAGRLRRMAITPAVVSACRELAASAGGAFGEDDAAAAIVSLYLETAMSKAPLDRRIPQEMAQMVRRILSRPIRACRLETRKRSWTGLDWNDGNNPSRVGRMTSDVDSEIIQPLSDFVVLSLCHMKLVPETLDLPATRRESPLGYSPLTDNPSVMLRYALLGQIGWRFLPHGFLASVFSRFVVHTGQGRVVRFRVAGCTSCKRICYTDTVVCPSCGGQTSHTIQKRLLGANYLAQCRLLRDADACYYIDCGWRQPPSGQLEDSCCDKTSNVD